MAEDIENVQYDGIATRYDGLEALPHSLITQQLVQYALLGDCSGQILLDIGGGSGLHARNAVSLGAERVDNVDVSPEMLQICEANERREGREAAERVACYVGDCTQPLDHLKLPGRDGNGLYDVIMVIWTFDHATNIEELEGMWRNVGQYCRPGGKVVSIRPTDPWKRNPGTFKYGVVLSDLRAIPGGARYTFTINTTPPFSLQGTVMEAHYDLNQARDMAKKFGFGDLQVVSTNELQAVKEDPEFWKDFTENPSFICVVGEKGGV